MKILFKTNMKTLNWKNNVLTNSVIIWKNNMCKSNAWDNGYIKSISWRSYLVNKDIYYFWEIL